MATLNSCLSNSTRRCAFSWRTTLTLDAARALVRAHLELHSVEQASIQQVVDLLPSPYVPPTGGLWVAYDADDPLGCAAFQTIAPDTAELKRVFVRQRRAGAALRARSRNTRSRRSAPVVTCVSGSDADTAIGAQRLYESPGFRRIEPYRPGDFGTGGSMSY